MNETYFNSEQIETDKSDKTIKVSNGDFLSAIFSDNPINEHPILVSFKGNPTNVPKYKWFGHPWVNTSPATMPDDANNYFSLARFRPNEAGEYRRKKSQFQSLHAVMLDDIGSKVPMERLTLSPTWLLETSPGNFQAGYILSTPINSTRLADQLMNAIVNAGLCDPGANGPTARLARLPIAVNGKHDPSFSCQLKLWSPEKRYSMQELVDGLQLEIIETNQSKRKRNQTESTSDTDNEQIWTPRPEENAVLTVLKKRNLYKLPLGEGKHDITCPWVDEHTNGIDSSTAYFEPDDNYPLGGFKCQHGHCSERHIRDPLHILNLDIKSARMKPTINVIKGEIHRIVDAAEHELASTQKYYQRGGIIVSVNTDPSTNETHVHEISQPALVRALSGVATWEQFDKRTKSLVRIDPPDRHARILFNANSYRQPYLRPDGSLMKRSWL